MPSDSAPVDAYGNNLGWTAFVPDTTNWQQYNQNPAGNNAPDWAQYVPTTWQAYNHDTNNDGTPDWAPYVPGNWREYNKDTNNDGTPDWAPYVTTGWQQFQADSVGQATPTWAPYVPTGVSDFSTGGIDYATEDQSTNNERTLEIILRYVTGSYATSVTATYEMPYAPDDFYLYVKRIPKLISAGGRAAAGSFGLMQSSLDVGHAYGFNIVTGWNELPSLSLSTVYLQLEGIEGAFLTDSLSYAWGADGMVCSSDLMLLGVSGWYGNSAPAHSWVRLPVASSGLNEVDDGISGVAVKANSISIPNGFDPRNPAAVLASLPTDGRDSFALYHEEHSLIGPVLLVEQGEAFSGPSLIAIEYPYALVLPVDQQDLPVQPLVEFLWLTSVNVPAALTTIAAVAPAVSSGGSIAVPVAAAQLSVTTPSVSSGGSIAVPVASIALLPLPPSQAGRQRTEVLIPTASITVAGLIPVASSGGSVSAPVASIAIAAIAPDMARDPLFSYNSLLLHFSGANSSTVFTDSSNNGLSATPYGNASISTAQSKYGGSAGYLDGNGDYLQYASNTALDLIGSLFTVEAWIYPTTYKTSGCRIAAAGGGSVAFNSSGGIHWLMQIGNTGLLDFQFYSGSGGAGFATTASISLNTWSHVAASINGSTLYLSINGTLQSFSIASIARPSTSPVFTIGTIYGEGGASGAAFQGYMDEFRITKGAVRYTSNFTPSATAFQDS